MSEIILYAGEFFTDSSANFSIQQPNFTSVSTFKEVKSLKVTNGVWITYSEVNYKGDIAVYKAGDYASSLKIENIRSFRQFSGLLETPDITVFDQTSYQGSQRQLKNPEYITISPAIQSHKVVNGVWILYKEKGYAGDSIVSIKGDEVSSETAEGLSGAVNSLKAYLTYEEK